MANKNNGLDLPLDDPGRRRLPPLLRRCWYSLNQAFRRRISHAGLTPDQFTILRTLKEHEPDGLSQYELATLIASDPNTVSSLLRRMSKAKLVSRKRQEADRRAMRVRVTPEGLELFEEVRRIAVDLQAALLEAIPQARREQFLADLDALAEIAAHEARKGSGATKKIEE